MATKFFEHPDYASNKEDWIKLKNWYEGETEALLGIEYLVPHELESEKNPVSKTLRRIRESRTTYTNFVEPVVSRYCSLYYREQEQLGEPTKQVLGDAFYDITGEGESLPSLIKEDFLPDFFIYGKVIAIIDAPAVQIDSKEDQVKKKIRPYIEHISPLDLKDWAIEREDPEHFGRFRWIRYEYCEIEARDDATAEPKERRYSRVIHFRAGTLTVTEYLLAEEKDQDGEERWNQVSSFVLLDFPRIPVEYIDSDSWISDVAAQQKRLYNLESTRDSIHLWQAHQRIFFIGDIPEPARIAVAEYTASFLPAGSTVATIEPVNTASIDANIERTTTLLFQIAFDQFRATISSSKAVEGASTQQEQKEAIVSLIKSQLAILENFINRALSTYAYFVDKTKNRDFVADWKFSREIGISDIENLVLQFQQLRDELTPTWRKSLLKKLAAAHQLADEDTILKEIEASNSLKTPVDANQVRNTLLSKLNG